MGKITQIDGLPVIDAKRPIMLNITTLDIRKADPKQPDSCAIARACMRELHVKEARIHLGRIYLRTNDSNWTRYQTPSALRDEIIAFDRGGTFQPCGARLLPVAPSQLTKNKRQGGKDAPDRQAKRKQAKKRRPYHHITDVRGGPAVS